ncbi:putative candidate secreted effector protein [Blumeria hordei DH14]|uniref:Putative candidate secreted effector protein n=1 Tax=Blumeria graminis f. sp. hordei (strain DH14) TaxID=546991 RepID=N1JDG4_BLUG1|nr:putative candidate secreted effector protein [Blumeria hordei DH14]
MKNLRDIFITQSLRLKAVLLILSISTNALLMQRRMNQPNEPGYYCNNQIYLSSDIETVRQTACEAFTYPRKGSRRPLLYTDDDNVENWIFEWSIPASLANHSNGVKKATPDKIIFNNNCEITGVLSFDSASQNYKLCATVPEVSTSVSSRMSKDPVKPFIQCGSLSLEIVEIQHCASAKSTKFLNGLVEVENSSYEIDGPWRRNILSRRVSVNSRRKFVRPIRNKNRLMFLKEHNIFYEIIVNNQNEARGMVVTHYVKRTYPTAAKCNEKNYKMSHKKPVRESQSIRLVCFFDTKFQLFPNGPTWKPYISRKRKTLN